MITQHTRQARQSVAPAAPTERYYHHNDLHQVAHSGPWTDRDKLRLTAAAPVGMWDGGRGLIKIQCQQRLRRPAIIRTLTCLISTHRQCTFTFSPDLCETLDRVPRPLAAALQQLSFAPSCGDANV